MGAVAVLPADLPPANLAPAVAMFLEGDAARDGDTDGGEVRAYQPEEAIQTEADSVVVVVSGVVAMRAIHPGGSQTLMGLFSAGDALLARSTDAGYVELAAYSNPRVRIFPLEDAALTREYAYRMCRSQSYLTAWSSVQSRPRTEHRLLGLLILLVERFGRAKEDGWVEINLRLTHQPLAEAICATRPTAAKAIRQPLSMGAIRFKGSGDFRRVHLHRDLAGAIMSG